MQLGVDDAGRMRPIKDNRPHFLIKHQLATSSPRRHGERALLAPNIFPTPSLTLHLDIHSLFQLRIRLDHSLSQCSEPPTPSLPPSPPSSAACVNSPPTKIAAAASWVCAVATIWGNSVPAARRQCRQRLWSVRSIHERSNGASSGPIWPVRLQARPGVRGTECKHHTLSKGAPVPILTRRIVWSICQRFGAQALLQRFQFLRRQQTLPRPLSLETQALVAQASRRRERTGGMVPPSPRRHQ